MARAYITRRAGFSSAHRLCRSDWDDARNTAVFGKCARAFGHGHNYELEVTIAADIDPKTDMIMNLVDLKAIMERVVIDPLDHRHFSHDVPKLKGVNTTAENLVVVFWKWLEPELPKGWLFEVRLQETENNVAFYRGE